MYRRMEVSHWAGVSPQFWNPSMKFIAQIPAWSSFCETLFIHILSAQKLSGSRWLTESSPKSLEWHSRSSPIYPLPYLPQPPPQPDGTPGDGIHKCPHLSAFSLSRPPYAPPPTKGPTQIPVHLLYECCLDTPASSEPRVALTEHVVHLWLSILFVVWVLLPS